MVISTLKDSIENVILEASKIAGSDFQDSKILYEEAQDMINQRNKRRQIEGKKALELKDILANAFRPIKDKKMGYDYEFAQAYYATEKYTQALHYLRKAKDPKKLREIMSLQYLQVAGLIVKSCTALAKKENEKKYWTEAENNCKRIIKSSDGPCEFSEWAIREQSDIYLAQGEQEKAKSLLEKNVRHYSSLYLNLAEIYAEEKNKEKMFRNLKQFLRENPTKWKIVHFNKKIKRFEKDEEHYALWKIYENSAEPLKEETMFSPWNLKGIFSRTA